MKRLCTIRRILFRKDFCQNSQQQGFNNKLLFQGCVHSLSRKKTWNAIAVELWIHWIVTYKSKWSHFETKRNGSKADISEKFLASSSSPLLELELLSCCKKTSSGESPSQTKFTFTPVIYKCKRFQNYKCKWYLWRFIDWDLMHNKWRFRLERNAIFGRHWAASSEF